MPLITPRQRRENRMGKLIAKLADATDSRGLKCFSPKNADLAAKIKEVYQEAEDAQDNLRLA